MPTSKRRIIGLRRRQRRRCPDPLYAFSDLTGVSFAIENKKGGRVGYNRPRPSQSMPLGPGTRLGPYEIVAPIGSGGMGEVYRATDTNLGRDVAIKVLPEAFAQDPERVARFEREAKTLAALNHPNIAQIYGLEKSQGTYALVMVFVDGEDLSQRIGRGPIPFDEALPIARQIAEALEAAHEQGIIHRDLKPANVKVRPDGNVKVLDFGLAKLTEPNGAAAGGPNALSMS